MFIARYNRRITLHFLFGGKNPTTKLAVHKIKSNKIIQLASLFTVFTWQRVFVAARSLFWRHTLFLAELRVQKSYLSFPVGGALREHFSWRDLGIFQVPRMPWIQHYTAPQVSGWSMLTHRLCFSSLELLSTHCSSLLSCPPIFDAFWCPCFLYWCYVLCSLLHSHMYIQNFVVPIWLTMKRVYFSKEGVGASW